MDRIPEGRSGAVAPGLAKGETFLEELVGFEEEGTLVFMGRGSLS